MTLEDLLVGTIKALELAQVPYMLTGSLASTFHGEPRATRDIDLVIDPTPDALERLIDELLSDGLYVDRDAARSALAERGQFNAIGTDAKVDFIVRKDRPFAVSEFKRRQRVTLLGYAGDVVTVEDLILAKLLWAAETDSDRQLRDVAGMVAVAGSVLDRAYVTRWANRLGIADAWRRQDPGAGA